MKRQGGRRGRAARSALRTAQSMATAKRKGRGRTARSALRTAQSMATAKRKGRGRTARSALRTAQSMATARLKERGRAACFHPQNRRLRLFRPPWPNHALVKAAMSPGSRDVSRRRQRMSAEESPESKGAQETAAPCAAIAGCAARSMRTAAFTIVSRIAPRLSGTGRGLQTA